MAEFALGAFGASVAVFQTLRGLRKLVDAFEELSHASTEIAYFHCETRAFVDVLDNFFTTVDESIAHIAGRKKKKRKRTFNCIVGMFDKTRSSMKAIAKKVYNSNHEIESVIWKLGVRLRWLWLRNSLTCLRLKMEQVKSTAILLTNTIMCESLNRQIQDLENKNKQVTYHLRSKLEYLTKRLERAQADVKQAAEALAFYKRSHVDVEKIFSDGEETLFSTVEQDIQKEADEIVSCNQQRLSSRRGSGETTTSLRSNTASKVDRGFIIPSEAQTEPGTANENVRLKSRTPSSIKCPPKQVSRDTSAENRPSISVWDGTSDGHSYGSPSLDTNNKVDALNQKVFGDRVRDDGTGVHVERGEWPQNVFNSSDQLDSSTVGNVGSLDVSEDLLKPRLDIPYKKTEGGSSKTRDHMEDSEKGNPQCDENISGTKEPSSQPDYEKEKWKPLPPFDEEDLKERRRRKSG